MPDKDPFDVLRSFDPAQRRKKPFEIGLREILIGTAIFIIIVLLFAAVPTPRPLVLPVPTVLPTAATGAPTPTGARP